MTTDPHPAAVRCRRKQAGLDRERVDTGRAGDTGLREIEEGAAPGGVWKARLEEGGHLAVRLESEAPLEPNTRLARRLEPPADVDRQGLVIILDVHPVILCFDEEVGVS